MRYRLRRATTGQYLIYTDHVHWTWVKAAALVWRRYDDAAFVADMLLGTFGERTVIEAEDDLEDDDIGDEH